MFIHITELTHKKYLIEYFVIKDLRLPIQNLHILKAKIHSFKNIAIQFFNGLCKLGQVQRSWPQTTYILTSPPGSHYWNSY